MVLVRRIDWVRSYFVCGKEKKVDECLLGWYGHIKMNETRVVKIGCIDNRLHSLIRINLNL